MGNEINQKRRRKKVNVLISLEISTDEERRRNMTRNFFNYIKFAFSFYVSASYGTTLKFQLFPLLYEKKLNLSNTPSDGDLLRLMIKTFFKKPYEKKEENKALGYPLNFFMPKNEERLKR